MIITPPSNSVSNWVLQVAIHITYFMHANIDIQILEPDATEHSPAMGGPSATSGSNMR